MLTAHYLPQMLPDLLSYSSTLCIAQGSLARRFGRLERVVSGQGDTTRRRGEGCRFNPREDTVFLQKPLANSFLVRIRRSNTGLEELLANDLQRECYEELCSKEEARECLTDERQTELFWTTYQGLLPKANVSEKHVAPVKPELHEFIQDMLKFGTVFSGNETKLASIFTLERQILEKQREIIKSLWKLTGHKKDLLALEEELLKLVTGCFDQSDGQV
ncbi:uncharacterized protein [Narcine bancroftii]|uniref:uncharacterized protein n=1 Tax=Narcine bancroftii TaxID=1343680 RepID=UPI0038319D08